MKSEVGSKLAGLELVPEQTVFESCPECDGRLRNRGVYIPGMRVLARLVCEKCEVELFADLPTGHGLPHPALLNPRTGEVHHRDTLGVFADFLGSSFRERSYEPVGVTFEAFRPLNRPILLNCLDWLYGHALLKLLNAQHHIDFDRDYDLVVVVPKILRWMVPEGAAEIWTVDLPLSRGTVWSDWLAEKLGERIGDPFRWRLSPAFPHPDPSTYEIERFTRIRPFPLAEWQDRATEMPRVTYLWRGDREWTAPIERSLPVRVAGRVSRIAGNDTGLARRVEGVVALAEAIRSDLGRVDFAVLGLEKAGDFPSWITDLRDPRPSDEVEKSWCRRYADSHVVVGIHGSNMLLPSGHAGATVEFVPDMPGDTRWGNVIQDLLVRGSDVRDALFRYRMLPTEVAPAVAGRMISSMIRYRPAAEAHFSGRYNDHQTVGSWWREFPAIVDKANH